MRVAVCEGQDDGPLQDFGHRKRLLLAAEGALDQVCGRYLVIEHLLMNYGCAVPGLVAATGPYLAYAAFHCSSRLCFAVSSSACETKREPT